MINLSTYNEYWQGVARCIPEITDVIAVTVDEEMAKKIQSLPKGSTTLFFLPPAAESVTESVDNFTEYNECVVFVMEKYDPQRKNAFSALESSQPVIEKVKQKMLYDMATGCPVMEFDISTLNTIPETKFFANFAGWSIGFKIIT